MDGGFEYGEQHFFYGGPESDSTLALCRSRSLHRLDVMSGGRERQVQ
jgi:hypothetical protein